MNGIGSNTLGARRGLAVAEQGRSRTLALALVFALAVAVAAYIRVPVPFSPVPITLQVLVVILAGAVLGPWLGAGAMATYLAMGSLGLPVFSGGGAGFAWLAGPTGGYLIAFPAAALVTGFLIRGRPEATLRTAIALLAGVGVIYLGGVAQLGLLTGRPLGELLAAGVFPFVLGDLAKAGVAFAVLAALGRRASN